MSELTTTNGTFAVPPDQDFNTISFQGSIQQVLQENVGKYVIVEFLIGGNNMSIRQGVLYHVAAQFLVLYDEFETRFVVCDMFSVKFVTFPEARSDTRYPPMDQSAAQNSGNPDAVAMETSAFTPSQAAYAHATRRNPATRL